ncbi:MAG: 50S ribosomal protein L25 [Dehalococcoidia bacterium]|nr:50S ribosomal protein L25 [Dehalococcoidia bacterium]MCA9857433.1 50S ribosomal protein L25 [Dehalococcoidia bacterium]MCB9491660.1 50S ribosomal protein L25 [Dehalococcoidia bacterium]
MTDAYQVQPRTVVGKAVSKLRREGTLPASIYGRGLESVAVQLPYVVARDLMNAHGYNSLINVQVEGESKPRPVVVKQVDQNPVTRELWHVDFYQVDLTRKISGPVPVHFVGESPAVRDLGGIFVMHADSVEVEALPADMPEALEVSLDSLTDFDTYLYAKDIQTGAGVTVISDPEHLLAAITRPRIVAEAAAEEIAEGEQEAEAAAEGGEEAAESSEEAAAE